MSRTRPAPGGGTVVEVEPERLPGWLNRFAARNGGLVELVAGPAAVTVRGGNGTTAELAVPFGPMAVGSAEPVEGLLGHLAGIGDVGLVLVRGGAHSIGIARDGVVLRSSTDRAYLQGRSAAGGWSQQRFARRRGNQLTASLASAADTAVAVLAPVTDSLDALVLAGHPPALDAVLADHRLSGLRALPTRIFRDIPEPRRAVLDEVAVRARSVQITVRPPGAEWGTDTSATPA